MSDSLRIADMRAATYLVTANQVIPLEGALLGFNHEEAREELHARATAHLRDVQLPDGSWLSEAAALGARLYRLTSLDGSTWTPLFEGTIHEWEPGDGDVTVTASDPLLWFAANDDQVKYPEGAVCRDVLKDILDAYGLPIGTLEGPTATLPAVVFDGKDGDLALKILQHGLYQGDKPYILRWKPGSVSSDGTIQRGAVESVAPGGNDPVYAFAEQRNVLDLKDHQSATDMVQEVDVVGNQGDDQAKPEIQRRIRSDDARTLGGRAILKSSDYDSPDAVQKAAQAILADKGKPTRERSATTIDLPTIRKADIVKVDARTLSGFCTVLSVSHDADELTMELTLADRGTALYAAQKFPDPPSTKSGGGSACGTDKLLAFARTFMSTPTPYVFGGNGSAPGQGMDCSRFVQLVFQSIGIEVGRSTYAQQPNTTPVPQGQQQAGDLAFYVCGAAGIDQHVGIVLEDGQSIINQTPPACKINQYTDHRCFVGFGRVPGLAAVNAQCAESDTSSSGSASGGSVDTSRGGGSTFRSAPARIQRGIAAAFSDRSDLWEKAALIVGCESSPRWNLRSLGDGGHSYGAWQIYWPVWGPTVMSMGGSGPESLYDFDFASKVARVIYDSRGNFSAWTCARVNGWS